eukprot:610943-Prorocentrum_minimum.AAC.1
MDPRGVDSPYRFPGARSERECYLMSQGAKGESRIFRAHRSEGKQIVRGPPLIGAEGRGWSGRPGQLGTPAGTARFVFKGRRRV